MAISLEIVERDTIEFKDIQESMKLARKENATETYEHLKKRYKALKSILGVAGVNMTDIDEIKE
ncbi:MAG: hypothetical protein IJ679_11250 [Lachnospiraceae bacterium]|nr:hypothetical protein [Lachnospiraceae bacterium]